MDAKKLATQLSKLEQVVGKGGTYHQWQGNWVKIVKMGCTVRLSASYNNRTTTIVYQDGSDDSPVDGVFHLSQLKRFVQSVKDVEIFEGEGNGHAILSARGGRLVREVSSESPHNESLLVNGQWGELITPWCKWEGWPYVIKAQKLAKACGRHFSRREGIWLTDYGVITNIWKSCYGALVELPGDLKSFWFGQREIRLSFDEVIWPLENVSIALAREKLDNRHEYTFFLSVFGKFKEKGSFETSHAYKIPITLGDHMGNRVMKGAWVALWMGNIKDEWFELPDDEMMKHLKVTAQESDEGLRVVAKEDACVHETGNPRNATRVSDVQAYGKFELEAEFKEVEGASKVLGAKRFHLVDYSGTETDVRIEKHDFRHSTPKHTIETDRETIRPSEGVIWSEGIERFVSSRGESVGDDYD